MEKECEHSWLKVFVGTRGEYSCVGKICEKCGIFEKKKRIIG